MAERTDWKENVWKKQVSISPSLITLDLCNLEAQIRLVEDAGLDMVHIDILDGHFSPSMPLGLDTVRQLKQRTDLIFEAHVMASEPDFFVEELMDIGCEQIVFHAETCGHIDGMLNRIHSRGLRAGIALKPATPLSVLEYVIEKCDAVLLMLINPGFAQIKGEAQVPYASGKVRELHNMIADRSLSTKVILDGRISREDIRRYGASGEANIFVAGSTCIRRDDRINSLCELKQMESM